MQKPTITYRPISFESKKEVASTGVRKERDHTTYNIALLSEFRIFQLSPHFRSDT